MTTALVIVAHLVGASSCGAKGGGFDSRAGHMPREQV